MLTIEDGTMPDAANSYVSLQQADAFLVPRGLWEASTPVEERERALIRAFDFLNSLSWKGDLPQSDRVAAWPRVNVPLPGKPGGFLPVGKIPAAVLQAQMELAGLALSGTDLLMPLERGGKIKAKSESLTGAKIDVIQAEGTSQSITYSDSAPVETYLPAVFGILRPWLREIPGASGAYCGDITKA